MHRLDFAVQPASYGVFLLHHCPDSPVLFVIVGAIYWIFDNNTTLEDSCEDGGPSHSRLEKATE